ncbi:MAG: hypothetical protein JSR31_06215 [Nitrospira sp.]|nr:hypothetical protein [Nitrospira sp.]
MDWTTGIATAHGIGISPNNAVSSLQAKEMTREGAWSVALRNLMKLVKDVHIDSTTAVSNFVTTNDEVRTHIEGFDSLCQFISGAWQLRPTQRQTVWAGLPNTRDQACVHQSLDEGVAGYRT